jgi:hypothetical protein
MLNARRIIAAKRCTDSLWFFLLRSPQAIRYGQQGEPAEP